MISLIGADKDYIVQRFHTETAILLRSTNRLLYYYNDTFIDVFYARRLKSRKERREMIS